MQRALKILPKSHFLVLFFEAKWTRWPEAELANRWLETIITNSNLNSPEKKSENVYTSWQLQLRLKSLSHKALELQWTLNYRRGDTIDSVNVEPLNHGEDSKGQDAIYMVQSARVMVHLLKLASEVSKRLSFIGPSSMYVVHYMTSKSSA